MVSLIKKIVKGIISFIPDNAALPILSGPLKGKRWIKSSGGLNYWLGSYESDVQRVFVNNIKLGDVVFDVGAHTGFYTLLASDIVGSNGKVFAFEPHPRNIGYLRKNLKINGCDNAVVIESAVSDIVGTGRLYLDKNNHFSGRLKSEGNEVSVITLDEAIKTKKLPDPNCIKIDVEGEELRVLRGAEQILRRARPIIFLSSHGDDIKKECTEFLKSLDYTVNTVTEFIKGETNEFSLAYFDKT